MSAMNFTVFVVGLVVGCGATIVFIAWSDHLARQARPSIQPQPAWNRRKTGFLTVEWAAWMIGVGIFGLALLVYVVIRASDRTQDDADNARWADLDKIDPPKTPKEP